MPPLQWTIDLSPVALTAASFSYEADPAELDALRRYAEVEDLTSFHAKLAVTPLGGGKYRVSGKLLAEAVQSSVVDLSAVPARIEEAFSVDYWPAALIAEEGEEASFEEDPPEPIVDGRIPIGELLCELLVISIDPYPRNEGDTFDWTPLKSEPELNPFAELVRLRRHNDPEEA